LTKAIVILLLALGIFGGAYYAAWVLYLRPQEQLKAEKSAPPLPPPPDPALPDYQKALEVHEAGDTMLARKTWQEFIERFPQSSKADEAKEYLGRINISLYLSPVQTPEKTVYIVKGGDVITKVAARLESTPELLMRSNNLQGSMLRIGQKLVVPPANFSLAINRQRQKVTLLQHDRFFREYSIVAMPPHRGGTEKKGAAKKPKVEGRVTEKVAWRNGARVTFADKTYGEAQHWILISPGGNNLYTDVSGQPEGTTPQKPPGGGYGLAAESMRELAALVRKNDVVIIE
jgi:LysM repeat protein